MDCWRRGNVPVVARIERLRSIRDGVPGLRSCGAQLVQLTIALHVHRNSTEDFSKAWLNMPAGATASTQYVLTNVKSVILRAVLNHSITSSPEQEESA